MFNVPLYLWWICLGFLLILLELVIPGFIVFFFGVGAIVTGLLLWLFPLPAVAQLLIFAVLSVASLVIFRRMMPEIFCGSSRKIAELPPDDEEPAGKTVQVVEAITPETPGKIDFEGSLWTAASEAPHPAGAVVTIVRRDNLTMIVR